MKEWQVTQVRTVGEQRTVGPLLLTRPLWNISSREDPKIFPVFEAIGSYPSRGDCRNVPALLENITAFFPCVVPGQCY